jgi:FkbH-like protein
LWAVAPYRRGMGVSDFRSGGISDSLHQMNHRLLTRLADHPSVIVVSSAGGGRLGSDSQSISKFWYAAKSPFSLATYVAVAEDARTVLRTINGGARKLLLVDLDDTIWGGVVGDVGWEGLRLGGHDAIGEAYYDFQHGLLALQRKGIAIGVVSKNDEAVALRAIDCHPEMLLKSDMLAGWRINWHDKAENIIDLVTELNLALDSVVFIDDNPGERGRVLDALPQVLVPEWPKDPAHYRDALERLNCFDQATITSEDRIRSSSYVANRLRREVRMATSSEEWLRSLGVKVELAELRLETRSRALQLLNKTNQMNIRTRRLTESDMVEWLTLPNQQLFTVNVSDRFGDLGLTGIISFSLDGEQLHIVDLVLSCRAFGRSIENLMLGFAVDVARRSGALKVVANYLPTDKNKPTLEFLSGRSGWLEEPSGSRCFLWPVSEPYNKPEFIEVTISAEAATCTLRTLSQ